LQSIRRVQSTKNLSGTAHRQICDHIMPGLFGNISYTRTQIIPWRCLSSGGNGGSEKSRDSKTTHPLPQLPLLFDFI